jgi:hypothetical protein
MMIATRVDFPEECHRRLRFEDNGRDCSFYVQETAWYSPECEQTFQSWNELFTGVSHELRNRRNRRLNEPGVPWHRCLALVQIVDTDLEELRCAQDGVWVASYLQRKRTRNANSFRGARYWVCWKPSSQPPLELSQLNDVCFLTMPASGVEPPRPEEVPLPRRLLSEHSLDMFA